jgi:thiol-disulfide isomerase/thioredoxin
VRKFALAAVLLLLMFVVLASPTYAEEPVARVVLFWSTTCPHCLEVVNNVLPPIQEKYGAKLEVKQIEVSDEANSNLFLATLTQYQIPEEDWAVPFLFIGDVYMVGSDQIAEGLVSEIERNLAAGGSDFLELPSIEAPSPSPTPATPWLQQKVFFGLPRWGTFLGLGLVAALLIVLLVVQRRAQQPSPAGTVVKPAGTTKA